MKVKLRRFWLFVDRALSQSVLRQTGILALMFLVALLVSFMLLSFSGAEWCEFCECRNLPMWLLPLYLLLDTNALNALYWDVNVHGWMLFASSITYLFGIFIFNGMIIGVITNAIDRRIESHRNGLIHYLKSGHHIIMGYDDMVPSIITDIFERDDDAYILLLTSVESSKITEMLKKSVAKNRLDRIIVNYGHRTAMEYYADIHLESAAEIYVVGNRQTPAHDALNVECVDSICRYLKDGNFQSVPSRITCVFEDYDTYEAFKTSEIFGGLKDLKIDFIPYNFYEGWARQVLVQRKYREKCNPDKVLSYPSIYGNGILPDEKRRVHIVFVGITNLSVAFAKEAAHLLHFPNFEHDNAMKTRITFIDINADKEMPLFITRNRHFFEVQPYIYRDFSESRTSDENMRKEQLSKNINKKGFLDVEFEFIKGDIFSKQIQDEICSWATDGKNQSLSIFITLTDQRRNFIIGMNMPDEVYNNEIPIFIRQDRADSFVTKLRESDLEKHPYNTVVKEKLVKSERRGRYANVYPFGMNDMAYCNEDYAYRRAKLINFLYKNNKTDYSKYKFPDFMVLDVMTDENIWEEANKYWSELTIALKWSNLYCAYGISTKLAVLRAMRGLSAEDSSRDMDDVSDIEIGELAAVEHNRWNVEKLLMGYRKANEEGVVEDKYLFPQYGTDLQKNKKFQFIHHDIRPFKDLNEVRLLDYEIVKYIPWILKKAGN
ncbi:MAG: hypothetical protein J6S89_01200 [Paludibacteraceae bacterium]|nr:hypothetical protein [Paludibacteraceae bacterium]